LSWRGLLAASGRTTAAGRPVLCRFWQFERPAGIDVQIGDEQQRSTVSQTQTTRSPPMRFWVYTSDRFVSVKANAKSGVLRLTENPTVTGCRN